jgi:hypothetical protein
MFLGTAVFVIIVIAPGIPLGDTWRRIFSRDVSNQRSGGALLVIVLIAVTVSFLWLLSGLLWASIIGPEYSARHHVVMGVNFLVNVLGAMTGVWIKDFRRPLLLKSAYAVSLDWYFVWALRMVGRS